MFIIYHLLSMGNIVLRSHLYIVVELPACCVYFFPPLLKPVIEVSVQFKILVYVWWHVELYVGL